MLKTKPPYESLFSPWHSEGKVMDKAQQRLKICNFLPIILKPQQSNKFVSYPPVKPYIRKKINLKSKHYNLSFNEKWNSVNKTYVNSNKSPSVLSTSMNSNPPRWSNSPQNSYRVNAISWCMKNRKNCKEYNQNNFLAFKTKSEWWIAELKSRHQYVKENHSHINEHYNNTSNNSIHLNSFASVEKEFEKKWNISSKNAYMNTTLPRCDWNSHNDVARNSRVSTRYKAVNEYNFANILEGWYHIIDEYTEKNYFIKRKNVINIINNEWNTLVNTKRSFAMSQDTPNSREWLKIININQELRPCSAHYPIKNVIEMEREDERNARNNRCQSGKINIHSNLEYFYDDDEIDDDNDDHNDYYDDDYNDDNNDTDRKTGVECSKKTNLITNLLKNMAKKQIKKIEKIAKNRSTLWNKNGTFVNRNDEAVNTEDMNTEDEGWWWQLMNDKSKKYMKSNWNWNVWKNSLITDTVKRAEKNHSNHWKHEMRGRKLKNNTGINTWNDYNDNDNSGIKKESVNSSVIKIKKTKPVDKVKEQIEEYDKRESWNNNHWMKKPVLIKDRVGLTQVVEKQKIQGFDRKYEKEREREKKRLNNSNEDIKIKRVKILSITKTNSKGNDINNNIPNKNNSKKFERTSLEVNVPINEENEMDTSDYKGSEKKDWNVEPLLNRVQVNHWIKELNKEPSKEKKSQLRFKTIHNYKIPIKSFLSSKQSVEWAHKVSLKENVKDISIISPNTTSPIENENHSDAADAIKSDDHTIQNSKDQNINQTVTNRKTSPESDESPSTQLINNQENTHSANSSNDYLNNLSSLIYSEHLKHRRSNKVKTQYYEEDDPKGYDDKKDCFSEKYKKRFWLDKKLNAKDKNINTTTLLNSKGDQSNLTSEKLFLNWENDINFCLKKYEFNDKYKDIYEDFKKNIKQWQSTNYNIAEEEYKNWRNELAEIENDRELEKRWNKFNTTLFENQKSQSKTRTLLEEEIQWKDYQL